MADLGRAQSVERGGGEGASDRVSLDFEGRLLRRRRLVTENGGSLVVDLPETTSLEDGDALVLESGARVAVAAADEPLLQITGPNLPRLAWHIGNRHTPCRIERDRLFIRNDHVLADMLRQLGAEVTPLRAPFSPEGGAYGHGRTMGHDHGGDHGHGHNPHATPHE
ncbi:urease accessory protein UreE [Tropicimonas isoalkanivorans]|uniref:Urease accessory protein UreE n=1 Tax=Tropicimonas isoalkanivorans TaxID=441112 RepID=A0A1I1FZM3_9RHOB|nr:urease accessory protein UreE [Tropicimonas isoalkanivorans]SFC04814.1 urease accessory protein [Tropicimonas isoalkanivorans]